MTEIILLLTLFGIKHFIADFLLQYPYMLKQKGIYGAAGGLHHSWIHGVLTFFILVCVTQLKVAVILALFDCIIHYHVDWAKQKLNSGLSHTDRKFWIWFGLDQTMHYLTYIAIIGIIVL